MSEHGEWLNEHGEWALRAQGGRADGRVTNMYGLATTNRPSKRTLYVHTYDSSWLKRSWKLRRWLKLAQAFNEATTRRVSLPPRSNALGQTSNHLIVGPTALGHAGRTQNPIGNCSSVSSARGFSPGAHRVWRTVAWVNTLWVGVLLLAELTPGLALVPEKPELP